MQFGLASNNILYVKNTFHMLTCVTRSAVYCGLDPLYNCKHIKSVQLSRGQMEEGVSLSLS